ncbi:tRNA (adenine(22)-N(1))-methyltransferase [Texcoconibacillus texcoconensis]|uniref:tRNA (Adenine22-N1)-methyltransferase n=1 Tax=Texcoconibacillus texcoconensis TaxID=1095777 RepID=A0A840QRE6_9BACI|nr:tRNA (adenine(22)-N(1))-methyltransferase TrmK [Texcoconibacillus texcoconensis]MBB5173920.1 tRNA (adenine22-N1)-methyltransferase [Texcoconibacillus texcoconensis]
MEKKTLNIDLPVRLEMIANYVTNDQVIADIGSDHALLPGYLVGNKKVRKAIAVEVNEGPMQAAQQNVDSWGLSEAIDVRKGDGLAPLTESDDIGTIVIAGMGGMLISSILKAGQEKLENVQRLILQPNTAADNIRRWLIEQNWSLVDETMIDEAGYTYEILVAERGDPYEAYDNDQLEKQLWLGPWNLKQKQAAFYAKWLREKRELESIDQQLSKAVKNEKTEAKRQQIQQRLQWLKEELS